jgi:hypothetical protein
MSSKRKLEEHLEEPKKRQLAHQKATEAHPNGDDVNDDQHEASNKIIEADKTCMIDEPRCEAANHSAPKPIPRDPPPILSNTNDSVIVSKSKALAGVTALAIAPIANDEFPALYSGHANGKICKWNLATNLKIWERQVFTDMSEGTEMPKGKSTTRGIRGIAIKEISSGEHLVYTWSNIYEHEDISVPNKVRVLKGQDGVLSRELVCEIDEMEIQPLISCIVFSKLNYNDEWEDAIIIGLEATAEVLDRDERYTDFDLDEAEDFAYGNILPFIGEDIEETWRGHSGIIRSMAVMPDKYIVSCSENTDCSAEMIILWSANEPGVPIHRMNLLQSKPDSFHPLSCLQGGISIYENKILLGCKMGGMLIPIDLVCNDNRSSLQIRGFAELGQRYNEDSSLKGCLVGSGDAAIVSDERCNEVLIFQITSVGKNPILDTDISKRDVRAIKECDNNSNGHGAHGARSMALGRIVFPKQETGSNSSNDGPEVLAMKGRWVVAGFECGSIVRAALLPERFKDETQGSNLYASSFLHTNDSQTAHFDTLDHPEPLNQPATQPQPPCIIQ